MLTQLITWPVALAGEVLRLPTTLRATRELVTDLQSITRRLDESLAGTVGRVENIDKAVTDLHAAFFAIMSRVPGAGRALRTAAAEAVEPAPEEGVTPPG